MPPKPVLVAIIAILLGMAGIIILLLMETVDQRSPSDRSDASGSDIDNNLTPAQQEKIDDIQNDVSNKKYRKQLENVTAGSTNEAEYLQNRQKNFWYYVFPAIIIMIVFIIWVYKKHKEWIH